MAFHRNCIQSELALYQLAYGKTKNKEMENIFNQLKHTSKTIYTELMILYNVI